MLKKERQREILKVVEGTSKVEVDELAKHPVFCTLP